MNYCYDQIHNFPLNFAYFDAVDQCLDDFFEYVEYYHFLERIIFIFIFTNL